MDGESVPTAGPSGTLNGEPLPPPPPAPAQLPHSPPTDPEGWKKSRSGKRILELQQVEDSVAQLLHFAGCTLAALHPDPISTFTDKTLETDDDGAAAEGTEEADSKQFADYAEAYYTTLNDIQLNLRTSIRHLRLSRASPAPLVDPHFGSLANPGGGSVGVGGVAVGPDLELLSGETVQEKLSQFSEVGNLINSRGIVAAYPLGLEGDGGETSWQGAPYAVTGVDDIGFALDIVTEVSALLNIDSSRVYAAGKSNGGGFVNLLACNKTSAAVFAAFAPVSAALYPDTLSMTGCDPGRSIPIINSHGTADATVPYTGKTSSSTDRSEPDIQTWREAWATRNECTSKTPTSTTKPFKNATEYEWACSGATVVGVTVEGLGHSWPTTLGLDPSGSPENVASFNMTSAFILPFFEAHTL
ncbi:hypothetical protein RQP46_003806 [Phenoliferia psychrophenolica]